MRRILLLLISSILLLIPPVFAPSTVTSTTTTTTTITVTGMAIPSDTTIGYGTTPLLVIIAVSMIVALIGHFLALDGEINTFILKLGLVIGGLMAMLSINSSTPSVIPYGLPVMSSIFLITYAWKRV